MFKEFYEAASLFWRGKRWNLPTSLPFWSWSAELIFGWILFAAGVLSVLLHKMTTTGRVIFTFLCDEISEAVTRLDFFCVKRHW